jgi:YD repeat-containing protein
LNRLSTVTEPGQAPTTYNYDANGNLGGYVYPNGVSTSYTYDALNRLTQMGSVNGAQSLSRYTYTLGAAGNRQSVAE